MDFRPSWAVEPITCLPSYPTGRRYLPYSPLPPTTRPSIRASSNQQMTPRPLSHSLYPGYKSRLRTPVHLSSPLSWPALLTASPTLIDFISLSCLMSENFFQPAPRPWHIVALTTPWERRRTLPSPLQSRSLPFCCRHPHPWESTDNFYPYNFAFSRMSCKWTHTVYSLVCQASWLNIMQGRFLKTCLARSSSLWTKAKWVRISVHACLNKFTGVYNCRL